MTQKAFDEAQEKLDYLTRVKRAEIVERIAEARSHGDLSENAEYDAARNEQTANESEIAELDYQLKNAQIIQESTDTTKVGFGSVVTVKDPVFGEETYTVMGSMEVNTDDLNVISNESPLGVALMGHAAGDVVTVKAPKGEYQLEIVRIELKSE